MIGNSYKFLDKIPDAIPLAMRRLQFVCKRMDQEDLQFTRSYLPKDEQFRVCINTYMYQLFLIN